MAVTVISAWMVASERTWKRNEGFSLFLITNILWVIWDLHDRVYLSFLCSSVWRNIRGVSRIVNLHRILTRVVCNREQRLFPSTRIVLFRT
jgi:hypothetical protein